MAQFETEDQPDVRLVKLWDPVLRLLHWALAISVIVAWGLGMFGPDVMTLHFYFGYVVIGLLALRLIWGLVGPLPARFVSFLYGPVAVLSYGQAVFTRKPSYWPGHNPLGALSVIALLAILALQVGTGLFVDADEYVNAGPLAGLVSAEANRTVTQIHDAMAWGLLVLVLLHLAAIAFYKLWKREDLVRPMITGWKQVRDKDQSDS